MSNPFRFNVISQSQHDAVARKPSPPVGHRPPPLFSHRPNVALIADDDPELFSSFGVRGNSPKAKSATSGGWISRRTRKEVEDFQDAKISWKLKKKAVMKEDALNNNIAKLKVGAYVSTKDPLISPLSRSKGSKGKRRTRMKVYGVIKKRSTEDSSYWLCKFENGKGGYCSNTILHVEISTAPKFELGKDSKNKLVLKEKDNSRVDEEVIKTQIVLTKVYNLPEQQDYSYAVLEKMWKPTFPWISACKLRNHVIKMKAKLSESAHSDSWFTHLQDDNETGILNSTTTKVFTMTTNSLNGIKDVHVNNLVTSENTNSSNSKSNVKANMKFKTSRLAKRFLAPEIRMHRKKTNIGIHTIPTRHYAILVMKEKVMKK